MSIAIYSHLPSFSLALRVMDLLLPRSLSRSTFLFHRMWQVGQVHFHPPAPGGRLRFRLKWSTVSELMYIERDGADMKCMSSLCHAYVFDLVSLGG
jgi:hypothetical protein